MDWWWMHFLPALLADFIFCGTLMLGSCTVDGNCISLMLLLGVWRASLVLNQDFIVTNFPGCFWFFWKVLTGGLQPLCAPILKPKLPWTPRFKCSVGALHRCWFAYVPVQPLQTSADPESQTCCCSGQQVWMRNTALDGYFRPRASWIMEQAGEHFPSGARSAAEASRPDNRGECPPPHCAKRW